MSKKKYSLLPCIVLCVLLWQLFQSTVGRAFNHIHGDLGDARFLHYLLEHSFQALTGNGWFFSPAFFYPYQRALAFSDTLLSAAFPYWILRGTGVALFASYELWLISLCILNFASMYLLLRNGCRVSSLAATCGTVLFSFSSPRITQIVHPQLLAHFWTPLVILFLLYARRFEKHAVIFGACAGGVAALQFYASYYLGWFLIYGLILAAILGLSVRRVREKIRSESSVILKVSLSFIGTFLLCIFPLTILYLGALSEVSGRSYDEVYAALPRAIDWIRHGKDSTWYRWLAAGSSAPFEHEKRLGVGLITMVVLMSAVSAFRQERHSAYIGFFILLVIATVSPFYGYSLWSIIHTYVPGAQVIRAPSRVILLLLVPYAFLLSFAIDRLLSLKKYYGITLLLALVAVLEQRQIPPTFPVRPVLHTTETLKDLLQAHRVQCTSFFYVVHHGRFHHEKYQLDAMWASLLSGVPTMNGYSGVSPKEWRLNSINITSSDQKSSLQSALLEWSAKHDQRPCLVEHHNRAFTLTSSETLSSVLR